MKVYTKTGDRGSTSLVGGKRVSKSHIRIDAYGTVDELIAYLGLLRDMMDEAGISHQVIRLQEQNMVTSAILASDDETAFKLPSLNSEDIRWLEDEIDKMEETLPQLTHFVLPGGNNIVSTIHIVRTICRRAERIIIALNETQKVPESVLIYYNRLSDYFFVLARKVTHDLKVEEIRWIPKLEK
ncbi:MAG: cob(I)yrinic acid a,c-diamide adenosyltransferase [Bacteroidales bacterium]|nr:cob(I)yrinic acid a,c-diamide adenosyltransferase [Bacteroidales bacterium]